MDHDSPSCAFCLAPVPPVDQTIDGAWQPHFWIEDSTYCPHPVCPECSREHIKMIDSEPTLKAGHERFLRINRGGNR